MWASTGGRRADVQKWRRRFESYVTLSSCRRIPGWREIYSKILFQMHWAGEKYVYKIIACQSVVELEHTIAVFSSHLNIVPPFLELLKLFTKDQPVCGWNQLCPVSQLQMIMSSLVVSKYRFLPYPLGCKFWWRNSSRIPPLNMFSYLDYIFSYASSSTV